MKLIVVFSLLLFSALRVEASTVIYDGPSTCSLGFLSCSASTDEGGGIRLSAWYGDYNKSPIPMYLWSWTPSIKLSYPARIYGTFVQTLNVSNGNRALLPEDRFLLTASGDFVDDDGVPHHVEVIQYMSHFYSRGGGGRGGGGAGTHLTILDGSMIILD